LLRSEIIDRPIEGLLSRMTTTLNQQWGLSDLYNTFHISPPAATAAAVIFYKLLNSVSHFLLTMKDKLGKLVWAPMEMERCIHAF
jgi:hypothetical protein